MNLPFLDMSPFYNNPSILHLPYMNLRKLQLIILSIICTNNVVFVVGYLKCRYFVTMLCIMLLYVYFWIKKNYDMVECVDEDLIWCFRVCCLYELYWVVYWDIDTIQPFKWWIEPLLLNFLLFCKLIINLIIIIPTTIPSKDGSTSTSHSTTL